jgi:hypothetical protein
MPVREARRRLLIALLIICLHVACGTATGPSPVAPGYVGEWTGTTGQGSDVRFTVSETEHVTSFTLAYNFSAACSGTLSNANLSVRIHTLDPPGPPPYDQPGFGFSTNDGTSGTLIAGHFSPDRRSASGQFTLVHYGTCGDVVVGTWTARRR